MSWPPSCKAECLAIASAHSFPAMPLWAYNGYKMGGDQCIWSRRQKIRGVVDVDWMWLISIRGISINSAIRVWLKSIRAFFCLFPWLKSIRAVIEINQGGFQSGLFTFNHVLDWNEVVTIVTIVYFQSRSRLNEKGTCWGIMRLNQGTGWILLVTTRTCFSILNRN